MALVELHHNSEKNFDVSANSIELSKSNFAAVCTGIKSILDNPKTLEYLETLGIPVIGYKLKNYPLSIQFQVDILPNLI